MNKKNILVILIVLVILCFVPVIKGTDVSVPTSYSPIQEKGFNADQPYFGANIDAVINAFSGNLIVTAPDVALPGRNGLGVGVTRVYNSNAVFYQEANPTNFKDSLAKPKWLGYGWDFNLGKIIPPERYVPRRHSEYLVQWGDGSTQEFIKPTNGENYKTEEFILSDFSKVSIYNNIPTGFGESNSNSAYAQEAQSFVITRKDGTKYYFTHWVPIGSNGDAYNNNRLCLVPTDVNDCTWYHDNKDPAYRTEIYWSDVMTHSAPNSEYRQDPYYGVYLTKIEDVNGNYITIEYYDQVYREVNDVQPDWSGENHEYSSIHYGFNDAKHRTSYGSPFIKKITDTLGREINFEVTQSDPEHTDINSRLKYVKYKNVNGNDIQIHYTYSDEFAPGGPYGCGSPGSPVCDGNALLTKVQIEDSSDNPLFPATIYEYDPNTFELIKVNYPTGGYINYLYNSPGDPSAWEVPVFAEERVVYHRFVTQYQIYKDSQDPDPAIYTYEYGTDTYNGLDVRNTILIGPDDEDNDKTVTKTIYFQNYGMYPGTSASFNWKSGMKLSEETYKNSISPSDANLLKRDTYFYDSRFVGERYVFKYIETGGSTVTDWFPRALSFYQRDVLLQQGILAEIYEDNDATSKTPKTYFTETTLEGINGYDKFTNPKEIVNYGEVQQNSVYKTYDSNNEFDGFLYRMHGTLNKADAGNDKTATTIKYLHENDSSYEGCYDLGGISCKYDYLNGNRQTGKGEYAGLDFQIVNKVNQQTVKDSNNNIISDTIMEYDTEFPYDYYGEGILYDTFANHKNWIYSYIKNGKFMKGNLNKVNVWDNNKNKWITTKLSYDEAGNIIRSIDANGNAKLTWYTRSISNYPTINDINYLFTPYCFNGELFTFGGECFNLEDDDLDNCFDYQEEKCFYHSPCGYQKEACTNIFKRPCPVGDEAKCVYYSSPPYSPLEEGYWDINYRYSNVNCAYPGEGEPDYDLIPTCLESSQSPPTGGAITEITGKYFSGYDTPNWNLHPAAPDYKYAYPTHEIVQVDGDELGVLTKYSSYTGDVKSVEFYRLKDLSHKIKIEYVYDDLGRLTDVVKNGDTIDSPSLKINYIDTPPNMQARVEIKKDFDYFTDYYNPTAYIYDSLGRSIQSQQEDTDGELIIANTDYNLQGKKYYISKPYEVSGTFGQLIQDPEWEAKINRDYVKYDKYDALSRVKTVYPLPGDDYTVETTYGNNWVEVEDEKGMKTKSTTEVCGACGANAQILKRVEEKDDSGTLLTTTESEFDASGNLIRIKDPEGQYTTNSFNTLGQLLTSTDPDSGTTIYEYDDNGNIIRSEDARGQVVEYVYDTLNRIKLIKYPTGANIKYEYDQSQYAMGKLTRIIDETGKTEFTYDNRGRVIKEAKYPIDSDFYEITYEYDYSDKLVKITYPNEKVVEYVYDDLGRLQNVKTKVNDVHQEIVTYEYTPTGKIDEVQFLYNLHTDYQYNERDWIESLSVTQLGSPLFERGYTYDDAGNIISLYEDADKTIKLADFIYDDLYRLYDVYDTGYYGGNLHYTYDDLGNRQTQVKTGITSTYEYDPTIRNKLIKVTEGSDVYNYGYDSNGNMIYRMKGNLVKNSDFEIDDGIDLIKNWDEDSGINNKVPDGWKVSGSVVYLHNDVKKKGVYSMLAYSDPGVQSVAVQDIPAEQTTYHVSGWVKTGAIINNKGGITAQCTDQNHEHDWIGCYSIVGGEPGLIAPNQDWTFVEFDVTINEANRNLRIVCLNDGRDNSNAANVWCDSITVRKVSEPDVNSYQYYIYNYGDQLIKVYNQDTISEYYYDSGDQRTRKVVYNMDTSGATETKYTYSGGNVIYEETDPINYNPNKCGNEIVEYGEVCDPENIYKNNLKCSDFIDPENPDHYFEVGSLDCNSDCKSFDTNGCSWCGDGDVVSPEQCEMGYEVLCSDYSNKYASDSGTWVTCNNCQLNFKSCYCTIDGRPGSIRIDCKFGKRPIMDTILDWFR